MSFAELLGFKKKSRVLVLGSKGMLGHDLVTYLESDLNVKEVVGLDYPDIDISNRHILHTALETGDFDYVINCAAITDTKGIEGDLKDRSYAINALAVKYLAEEAKKLKFKLIHISTDYVFSEMSKFTIDSKTADMEEFPVNEYGMHKLIGELFIQKTLPEKQYAILRVSWLYGRHNAKSFIHKFLANCKRTLARGGDSVGCTIDECSAPTSVKNLCIRISNVIRFGLHGTFTASDEVVGGSMSRHEFAENIIKAAKFVLDYNLASLTLNKVPMAKPGVGGMRYPKYSSMIRDSKLPYDKLDLDTAPARIAIEQFFTFDSGPLIEWYSNLK